jgi:hypothetical protein
MDEDGNTPERFRLPESFGESDDPVDCNPFPAEHPAYQVWLEATRRARAEICRINVSSPLTPENTDEWMLLLTVAKFDVWAGRGVKVVWTDDALMEYTAWLVAYANAWIDSVSRYLTSHPPPFPPEIVLADLHRRLAARVQHWKGEAHRYRLQQEEHAAAAAPEVQQPPSLELVTRRRRAIKKYRDDHDLDALGFARMVGISDSAVRGIIREDWTRFDRATQDRLLSVIGMSRDAWYE